VADDRVLATLERILVNERRADEIFTTLAMVGVDIANRRATVRIAGHPPPLLIAGPTVTPLAVTRSAALGLLASNPNEPVDLDLPDGAWGILAYTDGLIEARHGDEWLGTDGLCGMVRAYLADGGDTDELPGWLVAEAERRNGGPLADDVAMLLLTGHAVTAVPEPATRTEPVATDDVAPATDDAVATGTDRASAAGPVSGGRS
jgi:serine phosphatase RsbU (regulator of sigma subunit)